MKPLPEIWEQLRVNLAPSDSGYRLALIQSRESYRAFAAIELPSGSSSFVIEVDSRIGQKFLKTISTDAFAARFAQFQGQTQGRSAIAIVLTAPAFADLFVHLCRDLLAAADEATTSHAVARNIATCIDRWRRFVGRNSYGLSDQEERGLFGELVFLLVAIRHYGAVCALDAWKGPDGGIRDFEFDDCTVEVKTCSSEGSREVRVLAPEQLEPLSGHGCYLSVFVLNISATSGNSLPAMVACAQKAIAAQHCDADTLLAKLAAYGYIAAQACRYSTKFAVEGSFLYGVRDGFPRVRPADVPLGVTNVGFSVSMEAMKEFVVNAGPIIGDLPAYSGVGHAG